MNHSTLEIFIQVAETQSVTQAAKRLGRVQSNITTRIQQLEEELGVALFVRSNKKMVPSPAGAQFLSYARRILSLAEEAKQALNPVTPSGTLRLGAMEATAASRLPPLLTCFQQRCPQVEIVLSTQPTRQLTEGVVNAALDAALVCLPPGADGQPACPAELAFTPVFHETLMLVRPRNPGPLRFAAFASGCSYRALGERWLAAQQITAEVHEVNSYHSMLACAASGRYACLLPQSVLAQMTLPENCLSEPLCAATTQLIWRNGDSAPALSEWRKLLQSVAND
ncbi:LysR family transcriptional regulator [Klebsiella quasivariicola]|uniref:LysR family transcriptional regulator n=1 Tax=Klebsiella quasivariicola TaxID=2026240 RepID=UPI0009BAF914|nr:LysR family transcriptional regulator [Klebsiella quasivariicola]SLO22492.1 LysR family transcriptional regulator [Klebsiella quasivariicola]VGP72813.1 HTH-type transcriptional regulator GltR [Klebsiella quasivariicola]